MKRVVPPNAVSGFGCDNESEGIVIEFIKLTPAITLHDYASVAYLSDAVDELRREADALLPWFKNRSLVMLNSTAKGGGVAEMLPQVVILLNELGITTQWVVMGTKHTEFFKLTKRVHNLIHGEDSGYIGDGDRKLYEDVSHRTADELRFHLKPEDILLVHDPQPLGTGAILKRQLGLHALWRCHVGLDVDLPATRIAWDFLRPYAETFDHTIFSAPEYIPDFLADRATVIHPGIDPLSHKNRPLSPHKLAGILCNAGLIGEHCPVLTPAFPQRVKRLLPDGSFGSAIEPDEIGFLFRPIVAQVSRWDRLKGFEPLLRAFVLLKEKLRRTNGYYSPRDRHRLEIVRLVLAGPAPDSIQDDPEGAEVLRELCRAFTVLNPDVQRDIALLSLPMDSRKHNELTVNAIQRCATVMVQNSTREGFGLTATEAMWKGTPVLGTEACGLRQQIRNGIDGRLTQNPKDPSEIAEHLDEILSGVRERNVWARNAQKRVFTEFLIFTQLQHLLRVLAHTVQRTTKEEIPRHSAHILAQV